jgi:TolB-like protein
LNGAAANPDGLVTVSGLAAHAARLVRRLSDDRQHPYQAIVGADLVLAADPQRYARVTPPPLPTPAVAAAPALRERVAVLRFENLRPDPEQGWMEKALRQDFTTALASVSRLDVYEEPEVRFLARGAGDVIEAAQRAGMDKLVSGSYWVEDDRITITAHVKSMTPLQRVASARIDGRLDLFDLRGRIVLDLVM